jgi:hypothetical protein
LADDPKRNINEHKASHQEYYTFSCVYKRQSAGYRISLVVMSNFSYSELSDAHLVPSSEKRKIIDFSASLSNLPFCFDMIVEINFKPAKLCQGMHNWNQSCLMEK